MKIQKINYRGAAAAAVLLWAALLPPTALAQKTLNGTGMTGTHTDRVSITLAPGFSSTGLFHAYITQLSAPVNLGSAPSAGQNYVRSRVFLKPYVSVPGTPMTDGVMEDVSYYDGLGRPVQAVSTKAGPDYRDIIYQSSYDAHGRPERSYLPYTAASANNGSFKAGALTAQAAFYNGGSGNGVVTIGASGGRTPSYARTVYEASPLDRVLEQGFPGSSWQPSADGFSGGGHTVRKVYTSNSNSEGYGEAATTRRVARYRVALDADGVPTLQINGIYANNELYITVTRDEDWASSRGRSGSVFEFTDKQGRVVLKRAFNTTPAPESSLEMLSTYYVYDDMGRLGFVLPPRANPDAASVPTAAVMNAYCFRYRYDGRNRLVEKRLPGKGLEHIVYNRLDQVVATQDAVQRGRHEWTVSKYDVHGRAILTGLWNNGNAAITREALQLQVNGQTAANQWETWTGSGTGYSNRSWPVTAIGTTLSLHYYGRYDLPMSLPAAYRPTGYSTMVRGLPTASLTKVLGAGTGTSGMLWEVWHYDNLGRVVRTFRQHYKGGSVAAGNYDDITTAYSFSGMVERETLDHRAGSGSVALRVVTEHYYDHRNRLLETYKTVGGGTRTLVARNAYNTIGQLRSKHLHSTTSGSTQSQSIAYTYNERGWLRTAASPLLGLDLRYNTGTNKLYTGDIAYQVFTRKHTDGTTASGTYTYGYDHLHRLRSGSLAANAGKEELVYDRAGSITSLKRTATSSAYVDELSYSYSGGRLASVADASANTSADYMPQGTTNYTYDANGNLKTRVNSASNARNITAVTYNHLNLPQSVTAQGAAVSYVYDASGRKLRSVNGIMGQTRDYVGGIEYVDGAIELVHMEEGRVLNNGGTYVYEYVLKDHLGNARSGFRGGSGEAAAANLGSDYYPFGLQYRSKINPGSPKNNYLYNGKELQDRLALYDYGARFYDPVIGRWGSVDPLAEKYYAISPYVYAANNPIKFLDPDGKDIEIFYNVRDNKGHWVENSFVFNGSNMSQAPDNYFVQNTLKAYQYNVENGGGDNLRLAANSEDFTVSLYQAADDVHREGKVYWNPFTAHEYDGITISAATALEHEVSHAVSYLTDEKAHRERQNQFDSQYETREERRVITGSERKTGKNNGELNKNQVRQSHSAGKSIMTYDPTSTKESSGLPWSIFDNNFQNNNILNRNNRPFFEW